MPYQIQYILNNNIYLKKYLREHSEYYKKIIRHPEFIEELNELMRKEYKLTIPDKLEKLKNDISLFSSVMDVIK